MVAAIETKTVQDLRLINREMDDAAVGSPLTGGFRFVDELELQMQTIIPKIVLCLQVLLGLLPITLGYDLECTRRGDDPPN